MEREVARLAALVKELFPDGGFNMDSFESRFRLQKLVYLAKVFQVDLGYGFSWYLHGPYSPDLTRVAFDLVTIEESDLPKTELKKWAKTGIEKCLSLVNSSRPEGVSELVWLEALSSVLYLSREVGLNESEITDRMSREKPHISRQVLEKALEIAANLDPDGES